MMKFPLRMEPGCQLLVLGSSKHRSLCQRSQRHSGVFCKEFDREVFPGWRIFGLLYGKHRKKTPYTVQFDNKEMF